MPMNGDILGGGEIDMIDVDEYIPLVVLSNDSHSLDLFSFKCALLCTDYLFIFEI